MRRSRCKRNQPQAGGGLGGTIRFDADPVNELVSNGVAWRAGGSCLAETRPGFLFGGVSARGLPGMSGGARRKGRKGAKKGKRSTRKERKYIQSGGRYGADFSQADTISGTPSTGGYMPVSSIGCEKSFSTIPDSRAADTLNSRASELWNGPRLPAGQMGGGSITGAPITWPNHGAGSGSPSEICPTARYAQNVEAPIVSSAGTNIMVNTPINYPQMNPACLKTGGGRRKSRRSSKKSKKSRKVTRRR